MGKGKIDPYKSSRRQEKAPQILKLIAMLNVLCKQLFLKALMESVVTKCIEMLPTVITFGLHFFVIDMMQKKDNQHIESGKAIL